MGSARQTAWWNLLSVKIGIAVSLLTLIGGGVGWARDKDTKIEKLEAVIVFLREDVREIRADVKELLKRGR